MTELLSPPEPSPISTPASVARMLGQVGVLVLTAVRCGVLPEGASVECTVRPDGINLAAFNACDGRDISIVLPLGGGR